MRCMGRQLVYSPSDLANFVAFEHLAELELGVALQGGRQPSVTNAYVDLIKRKGEEYEASFLDALREAGRAVTSIGLREPRDFEAGARATAGAMRAGAEYISRPSSFCMGGAGSRTFSSGWNGPPRSARGATRFSPPSP